MWKNGSTATVVSSSVISAGASVCSMFATRLRWVSMTPLLSPVVPDEYGRTTTSSGPTSACSVMGAPS